MTSANHLDYNSTFEFRRKIIRERDNMHALCENRRTRGMHRNINFSSPPSPSESRANACISPSVLFFAQIRDYSESTIRKAKLHYD